MKSYKNKTMKDWNSLTELEQNEIIMQIGGKLEKQEIWYWEGLVYSYRTLQDRIDKAIKCLGISEEILKSCEIYDVNGIELYKILIGSDKE